MTDETIAAGTSEATSAPAPAPVVPAVAVATPPDWRAALPEDLKAEKSLESFKDVGALAKSYVEGAKLRGRSIPLPPEGATPEELAAWRTEHGGKLAAVLPPAAAVPASPDKYVIKPHDNPQIPQFNDQRVAFYKDQFHAVGMTQAQVDAVTQAYVKDFETLIKAADDSNRAQLKGLREQWGEAAFAQATADAEKGVVKLAEWKGMDVGQVRKYLDDTRKGNDPILFQLFAGFGELTAEDVSIGVGDGVTAPSPAGVQEKGNAIRAEMAKLPLGSPRVSELQAQLEALYKGASR